MENMPNVNSPDYRLTSLEKRLSDIETLSQNRSLSLHEVTIDNPLAVVHGGTGRREFKPGHVLVGNDEVKIGACLKVDDGNLNVEMPQPLGPMDAPLFAKVNVHKLCANYVQVGSRAGIEEHVGKLTFSEASASMELSPKNWAVTIDQDTHAYLSNGKMHVTGTSLGDGELCFWDGEKASIVANDLKIATYSTFFTGDVKMHQPLNETEGGTGCRSIPALAKKLNLDSMAYQDANSVRISGGKLVDLDIVNVTDGPVLTSGGMSMGPVSVTSMGVVGHDRLSFSLRSQDDEAFFIDATNRTYIHKVALGESLGVPFGGTGRDDVESGKIPFGNGRGPLDIDKNLFYDVTKSTLNTGRLRLNKPLIQLSAADYLDDTRLLSAVADTLIEMGALKIIS